MIRRHPLVIAGTVAALLVLVSVVWPAENRPERSASKPSPAHLSDRTTSTLPQSQASAAAKETERLLPFTLEQIAQAAHLAARFTAAYTSHRYDQTLHQYIQRLAPMASSHLLPTLERSAGDSTAHARRRARQELTVGKARAGAIRTLGPSSIIFVLTATTRTTARAPVPNISPGPASDHPEADTREKTSRFAVTTIRHGEGWRVYAIELAAVGDWGEGGAFP